MAKYTRVGSVYKREPEWPGIVVAIILIVIGIAIFS